MSTVVGLFETRDQAQQAVQALRNAGIPQDDISLVMRDRREAQATAADIGAGSATAAGAAGGALLGGLAGWLVGIGALAIPGIGPIVAAGPLAAALTGGAIGAATGGLLGALVDAGVPEEEARTYQSGVERGAILLSVRAPDGREQQVRDIMNRAGMRDMAYHRDLWNRDPNYAYDTHAAGPGATVGGGVAGAATGAVLGGVVGGPVGAAAGAAIGGAAGAATGAAADWASAEPAFRNEWQSSPYRDRYTWSQVSPAYQYGWEAASRPEYANRSWDQLRPELQRNWRYQGAWNDYEPMVRNAWERRQTWSRQTTGNTTTRR